MLYVLFLLLVALTAVVVAAEMATYCTRRERLIQLWRHGNRGAKLALVFLRAPRWYLAGSQLAGTALTLATGAMAAPLFGEPAQLALLEGGMDKAWASPVGFWGAILCVTLFSTVFANLLPKRFAFSYADFIAVLMARPAYVWIRVTAPVLVLLNWIVDRIGAGLRLRDTPESLVTEADVLTLLAEGRKDRLIDEHEFQIARNALALSDLPVTKAMTPRDAVKWIDLRAGPKRWREQAIATGRSYAPVSEGNLDEMRGVLRVRDLLALDNDPTRAEFEAMLQPTLFVPPTATALGLFRMAKEKAIRMAAVADEHGHVLEIVTLNDLVVELIGEAASLADAR